MSLDYNQLKAFVKEEMAGDVGGVMVPSAPAGIPHRMPAADTDDDQQNMGDPKANKLYSKTVKAREVVEEIVEALDEPIYDAAYEQAFKASSCLRKTLISLVESGAHPMPDEEVVAPDANRQRWGGFVPYKGALAYGSDSMAPGIGIDEAAKIEMAGLSSKIQQLIGVYNQLTPVDKQAFMAFIMGTAGPKK
jgi:hypothetical protein